MGTWWMSWYHQRSWGPLGFTMNPQTGWLSRSQLCCQNLRSIKYKICWQIWHILTHTRLVLGLCGPKPDKYDEQVGEYSPIIADSIHVWEVNCTGFQEHHDRFEHHNSTGDIKSNVGKSNISYIIYHIYYITYHIWYICIYIYI